MFTVPVVAKKSDILFYLRNTNMEPPSPGYLLRFMRKSGILEKSQKETLYALSRWIQLNLNHETERDKFNIGYYEGRTERFIPLDWAFINYGPTSISKVAKTGCHGAASAMNWALRTVNIPSSIFIATPEAQETHASIKFPSMDLVLPHLDSLYSVGLLWDIGIIPITSSPNPQTKYAEEGISTKIKASSTLTSRLEGRYFGYSTSGHFYIPPGKIFLATNRYNAIFDKIKPNDLATWNETVGRIEAIIALSYPTLYAVNELLGTTNDYTNKTNIRIQIDGWLGSGYYTTKEIDNLIGSIASYIKNRLDPIGFGTAKSLAKLSYKTINYILLR